MTGRSVGMVAAVLLAAARGGRADAWRLDSRDIMPALLPEVRGLRAAIEQMTSSASRVQLALGRLQLQEQRLTAANGRLAEIRIQLAGTQRRAAELQEQVAGWKACCRASVRCPDADPNHDRRTGSPAAHQEMPGAQREGGKANADVQRLTSPGKRAANDVSAEQARWSDLNQRLEDLERSLRRREVRFWS